MKQRDIFIGGEGDQWFRRNKLSSNSDDPLLHYLRKYLDAGKLLEIGCSDGKRLDELSKIQGLSVSGVEPSLEAVIEATNKGLDVQQGTAEKLEYGSESFDWVVFGFCLYLCDRDDLFAIAAEADRVLKNGGRLIVYDFDPGIPCTNKYHHMDGVESYKMDYAGMFLWNPAYSMQSKEFYHHGGGLGLHANRNERVSISMLIKHVEYEYIACDAI